MSVNAAPTSARRPFRERPFGRFLHRLWRGLNAIRRLVFGLIALFLLLIFLIVVFSLSGGEIRLQDRTTLVFNPQGKVVEQFTQDPAVASIMSLGGDEGEVRMRDVLQVLRKAKTDSRIERVVLDVDGLELAGWASTREVAAAIRELRAAGKPVVAFTEGGNQQQYLLNATAERIALDPMNGLMLEGIGRYRQYYRELLQDKLGVDMQLFKVGTFKSAAEPYVLDESSAAAEQADLFWMNDIWSRYLTEVARDRKIPESQLRDSINNAREGIVAAQGDQAQYALTNRWVDALQTREQFNASIAAKAIKDEDNTVGYRAIGYDDYLQLAQIEPDPESSLLSEKQVGIVVAEGDIVSGEQPPGAIGGESTAALLRDARKDKTIKAVVLRVSSPGGEVFPSEQIRREVAALRAAGKPVVVSMGDVAASGGYWISMNANRIYADPSTITGSIGIYGVIPNLSRALDKIGVHTDGVSTTPVAGAFDPTRPLDAKSGAVIQSVIEKGYRDFTGRVAKARGQTPAAIDAVAQGRVWSGAQAKERGLVDAFGNLRDAVDHAASLAKLGKRGEYSTLWIEEHRAPFSGLFSRLPHGVRSALIGTDWTRDLLRLAAPQAEAELRFLQRVSTNNRGRPVTGVAHCFCSL